MEELKIIALCLTRKGAISQVLDLQPDMFEDKRLGNVFKTIKDAFTKDGTHIDALMLKNIMGLTPMEVVSLTESNGANVANIAYHAAFVKESWLKREFRKTCMEAITLMEEKDVFDNITGIQEATANLLGKITSQTNKPVSEEIDSYRDYFFREDLLVESGIPSIDDLLTVRVGDLCIVAARPAMGKTGYAISVANRLKDTHVLFFSLEMSKDRIKDRFMANQLKIDGQCFVKKQERLTEDQMELIFRVLESKKDLYIFDNVSNITGIITTILVHRLKHPNAKIVVFVDYLQLVKTSLKNTLRTYELESISYSLKEAAKTFNAGVIALCQIGRSAEARGGDKVPNLSDLKDSGSIEQAADSVVILYRPEYYGFEVDETGASTEGVANIIVAKQRDGETGRATCRFTGKYFLFSHTDPSYISPF